MKIIKQGKMPKCGTVVRLKCNECGTVFDVDEGEYEIEWGMYGYDTFYKSVCPFCRAEGYKHRIYIRGV